MGFCLDGYWGGVRIHHRALIFEETESVRHSTSSLNITHIDPSLTIVGKLHCPRVVSHDSIGAHCRNIWSLRHGFTVKPVGDNKDQGEYQYSKFSNRVLQFEHEGKEIKIPLQYERLPEFCYHCGIIGHIESGCPTRPLAAGSSVLPPQYGSWLKATGHWNPFVSRRPAHEPGPSHVPEDSDDETIPYHDRQSHYVATTGRNRTPLSHVPSTSNPNPNSTNSPPASSPLPCVNPSSEMPPLASFPPLPHTVSPPDMPPSLSYPTTTPCLSTPLSLPSKGQCSSSPDYANASCPVFNDPLNSHNAVDALNSPSNPPNIAAITHTSPKIGNLSSQSHSLLNNSTHSSKLHILPASLSKDSPSSLSLSSSIQDHQNVPCSTIPPPLSPNLTMVPMTLDSTIPPPLTHCQTPTSSSLIDNEMSPVSDHSSTPLDQQNVPNSTIPPLPSPYLVTVPMTLDSPARKVARRFQTARCRILRNDSVNIPSSTSGKRKLFLDEFDGQDLHMVDIEVIGKKPRLNNLAISGVSSSSQLSMDGANGNLGGLAMLWQKEIVVNLRGFSDRMIDVDAELKSHSIRITGVYGQPDVSLRREAWNKMKSMFDPDRKPWVLFGDLMKF
ncbi:OLC1v1024378C1 [Oldenlandia corymbosa var. corymbosa]|uniref:OLC1v1024378C1 n=1 Tax=Oldenlandia corymbosa var. corymbosa TaxID=529605 RepID=A0AAV1C2J4_OLDCO|nr:OLC1v1024378C1 [Oldenlandia corymbosa var. corymbosa]